MKVFSSKRVSDSCSDNRKSKIQNLKLVGIVALIVTFAMCGAVAEAQQPTKIPQIGYLTAASVPLSRPASRPSGRVCENLAT